MTEENKYEKSTIILFAVRFSSLDWAIKAQVLFTDKVIQVSST